MEPPKCPKGQPNQSLELLAVTSFLTNTNHVQVSRLHGALQLNIRARLLLLEGCQIEAIASRPAVLVGFREDFLACRRAFCLKWGRAEFAFLLG